MGNLRIALAQVNMTLGDFEENSKKIIYFINRGISDQVDIITFPELAISGYPPEDLLFNNDFLKANKKFLSKIVSHVNNITAVIGFVDHKKFTYNAAAIISNRKLVDVYHKALLPNYGVFDEKRYFMPGARYPVYKYGDITFGVNICEDIWVDEGPVSKQCKDGRAVLIFNISASPYHADKGRERTKMFSERALKNNAFMAYNNLVGGQDELVFDGHSLLMDKKGKLLAAGKQFEEDYILYDLNINPKTKSKNTGKKPYSNVVFIRNVIKNKKYTSIQKRKNIALKPLEEIFKALVLGTRDYVKKSEFEKVAVGLSGGIDSSLTAAIAVEALGTQKVIGVTMPSPYTSKESLNDANILSLNLGIEILTLPIKKAMKAYTEILSETFKGKKEDITEENIQARIRGNLLMALSNKFGWLVLTTGNKSEISVGYCTLYGDTAGGFSVLKDVPKTMVYRLSCYINRTKGIKIIPDDVIKRPPSAELRLNQKDQDSLPPYDILDAILHAYVEEDKTLNQIISKKFEKGLTLKVLDLVDKSEYKRRQGPPGIKITPKAFGKDRRRPIVNKFMKKCF
ncbi:MAG TPA: NAD+ synthase [Nitrospinota bacterium]|jgi:NAD+ synthase (glutamine-hydrolysing)|nr:NAD+ synthase [Nitrospinota bacterium]